jgi:hypothetical protein
MEARSCALDLADRSRDQELVWFKRSGHQRPREAKRAAV